MFSVCLPTSAKASKNEVKLLPSSGLSQTPTYHSLGTGVSKKKRKGLSLINLHHNNCKKIESNEKPTASFLRKSSKTKESSLAETISKRNS